MKIISRILGYAMFAFMAALVIATLLVSTGCGSVNVKQYPDGSFEFSSKTLWKDVEAASFQSDDFVGELGSSKAVDDARTLMAMCLLFPTMDGCPKQ